MDSNMAAIWCTYQMVKRLIWEMRIKQCTSASSSQDFRRHPDLPESHQSSLQKASLLTRVTSVKSQEGIVTHQSHISQVSRRHPHSPESHQSSLQKASLLARVTSVKSLKDLFTHQSHIIQVYRRHPHFTRVTSVKSLKGILTHQSHISQISRRHPHSPESHQPSL